MWRWLAYFFFFALSIYSVFSREFEKGFFFSLNGTCFNPKRNTGLFTLPFFLFCFFFLYLFKKEQKRAIIWLVTDFSFFLFAYTIEMFWLKFNLKKYPLLFVPIKFSLSLRTSLWPMLRLQYTLLLSSLFHMSWEYFFLLFAPAEEEYYSLLFEWVC